MSDSPMAYEPEQVYYMEHGDKLVIAIDVGNTNSSVTLAHLAWGTAPLSRSGTSASAIRTVLTYPFSTPTLTPVSSRAPSLIYYDQDDRARAFGTECLLAETKERARDEGWTLVKGFKEQMRPRPSTSSSSTPSSPPRDSKRLVKKTKAPTHLSPSAAGSTTSVGLGLHSSAKSSTHSLTSTFNFSPFGSFRAVTPEGVRDATDESYEDVASEPRSPTRSNASKESSSSKDKKDKTVKVHHGPKLKDIWADHLKVRRACIGSSARKVADSRRRLGFQHLVAW
ncbi:hypothetical protein JCM10212_005627 [Sporobolomyces blumeae]